MLLAGTDDGVYRADGLHFDSAEQVLDSGRALRVRRFDGWDGVFAATKTGLFRSTDGGRSWTDLGVPREEVYSVLGGPDGERLYAGTHPAHLYVSEDGGGERTDGSRASSGQRSDGTSWRELEGFQDLPSREEWYTPRHRNEAHVRSLGAHPDAPDRVIAGVEVGGVHVSEDRGETWTERRDGLHDDVHHVLVLGPDEYVASCGGGLYRTADAGEREGSERESRRTTSDSGETWTRLDDGLDHTYFREAFFHDGVLYAAAARSSPGTWSGKHGADGALFESRDRGNTFEALAHPGQPEEVVLAWTVSDGTVVAGTNEGRILVREMDGWITAGKLPAGVSSLCAL